MPAQRAAAEAHAAAPEGTLRTADATRRESDGRYQSLFAASLDAVLLTEPGGAILAVNEAACRLFRRSESELTNCRRGDIVDTSDPRLRPALDERDRSGRFVGELTFRRGDGSTFVGEISSAVFRDCNGALRTSMVIRDITEHKRAEAEMRASREQMRAMAARVQEAREEERAHVAREIHDVLAQELTRLKIDLVWLHGRLAKPDKAQAREMLASRVAEMAGFADMAIESVQRIATELRPAVLDSLGLCAAVEWQARDFQERSGIPCRIGVPAAELPARREVATAAFRILQESLTNVRRHAGATRVDVRLQPDGGDLRLSVMDNGRGIPAETLENPMCFGLAGMRERALLLGGECEIRSQPGAGTTIAVRLPL